MTEPRKCKLISLGAKKNKRGEAKRPTKAQVIFEGRTVHLKRFGDCWSDQQGKEYDFSH